MVKIPLCMYWLLLLVPFQSQVELGDKAYGEGRFDDAVDHYKRALAKKESAALFIKLGHAQVSLHKYEEAVQSYNSAVAISSDSGEVFQFLGQAQYMAGRFNDALISFRRAMKIDPKVNALKWTSRCLAGQQEWIRAESDILLYLRDKSEDVEALEILAYIFMQTERPQNAAHIYMKLAQSSNDVESWSKYLLALSNAETSSGRYGEAIDALEMAWRLGGSGNEIHQVLADLYLHKQMYYEAAGCYARLIFSTKRPTAEDLYRLGSVYYQTGEFTSAKEMFEKAYSADPIHTDAILYLGHIAARQGFVDEARRAYTTAVRTFPSSSAPWIFLADLEMKNGKFLQAAEAFLNAIRLGERRVGIYYNYIFSLLQAGKRDEAIDALKEAMRTHPMDRQLRTLLEKLS